jgi:hypothetical protein
MRAINTARNLTLGICQVFRFYEMPIKFRVGSKVAKTVKTTKNFPLTIELVRTMFQVADLCALLLCESRRIREDRSYRRRLHNRFIQA